MYSKTIILTAAAFSTSAYAASAALYGQCGGINWTGATTCASGSYCKEQNPYYYQCVAGTSSAAAATHASSSVRTSAASTHSSSSVVVHSTSSAVSAPASSATAAGTSTRRTSSTAVSSTSAASSSGLAAGSGTTYKASFTEYGAGDDNGSGNCNTATTACGFYTSPGYSAAVSQNEFGVGPGAGAGPACGTCWKLTAETDSSGNALSNAGNSIVVQVTNLCPVAGNPLCSQNGLTGTNQYGANLNFDLCIQSDAPTAFFGNDGTELALGTAVQVSCSEWSGTVVG